MIDEKNFVKIDLSRFVNDEKYRQECIKIYDTYKHSFNILEVISTIPHFFQYVKLLSAAKDSLYRSSVRFRFTYDFGEKIIEKYLTV